MDKYLEMKEKIFERINASWDELIALNDDLADHPEISGQEFETSRKIVELLNQKIPLLISNLPILILIRP